ncbi:MAG: GntR family transcriptional regulator [Roseiarcus sp.]
MKTESRGDANGARSRAGRKRTVAPKLGQIHPVDETSIERQVYRTLRFALMTGAIEPGATLTTRSLSAALGISATPVREALKRLDADGAVAAKNKSAFYVNDPDQADFEEILEIRLSLEGLAIKRSASRVTRANVIALRALNKEYQEIVSGARKSQSGDALRANFRFHFEVYNLSGAPKLVEMIETLWLRIGPTLHHYTRHHSLVQISDFHNQIMSALTNGDPISAEEALRKDLVTAARAIIPHLRRRTPNNR